jgi:HD-like signal output (HDOD) protein
MLLKEWEIPDVVCNTLEFQSFADLSPPSSIPEELRQNVAVLYLAHLCYHYMQGEKEKDLSICFLEDYMDILKCRETSVALFVETSLIPALDKKKGTFPKSIQNFIANCKDKLNETERF